MDLLESTEYYIWWLKNHHASISLTQIEQEVDALIARFNRRNSRDMLEDFYFSYLQDVQAFGYDVRKYEEYCAFADEYNAHLLDQEYGIENELRQEVIDRDWYAMMQEARKLDLESLHDQMYCSSPA